MKLNYKIILFVFLIFSVFAISAQNKKDKNIVLASGTVYNPQGIPLSNVVITVDEGKSNILLILMANILSVQFQGLYLV